MILAVTRRYHGPSTRADAMMMQDSRDGTRRDYVVPLQPGVWLQARDVVHARWGGPPITMTALLPSRRRPCTGGLVRWRGMCWDSHETDVERPP
jgi:hypothetical protein